MIFEEAFEKLVEKAFDLLVGRISDAKKAKDERRGLVQQVQMSCDTRAVYTKMHAQFDKESMFAALVATRRKLQGLKSKFTDKTQQQIVANIIGELDAIERWKDNIYDTWPAGREPIDRSKVNIIKLVMELSETVGLPFTLPSNLTSEVFWNVELAVDHANENPDFGTYRVS
jgi:hypothetical protein